MRYAMTLAALALFLGGCAIVPADNRYAYSGSRGYEEHSYHDRDYDRGYYNSGRSSGEHQYNGDPFEEHGH